MIPPKIKWPANQDDERINEIFTSYFDYVKDKMILCNPDEHAENEKEFAKQFRDAIIDYHVDTELFNEYYAWQQSFVVDDETIRTNYIWSQLDLNGYELTTNENLNENEELQLMTELENTIKNNTYGQFKSQFGYLKLKEI